MAEAPARGTKPGLQACLVLSTIGQAPLLFPGLPRFPPHFHREFLQVPGVGHGRDACAAANEGLKAVGIKLLANLPDSFPVPVMAVPLGFGPGQRQDLEYPGDSPGLGGET